MTQKYTKTYNSRTGVERKVHALKWPKSKSLQINYMHKKNDLLFINSPHQTWSISSFVKVNSYVLHHLS